MLTYEECLEMSDLTADEVDAIAEHEHVDPIIAMALGNYILCHEGDTKIRRIIMDDIEKAERDGDLAHARVLQRVLEHFIATHPENEHRAPERAGAA